MAEHHELYGGKLHVYRRENSRFWQCSTYLAGKNRRTSTGEESLSHAKDFAEDWYLELKGKHRAGDLKGGKTFKQAADQFLREYEVITQGQRSPRWVKVYESKIRVHLVPFFGKMALAEITAGKLQDYRIHRREATVASTRKPPARSTLHQEIVAVRQVLKTASRHGWLEHLPDLSEPYRSAGKVTHRAWFSPSEYKKLYEATRRRALNPPKKKWGWSCEQLHDYVLFMANTGLRPDEANRLQFRDVTIVEDEDSGETILEIEVRGKRGVGYCKSMTGAVLPFRRLQARSRPVAADVEGVRKSSRSRESRAKDQQSEESTPEAKWKKPEPNDPIFPTSPRDLLNSVLDEEGLKFDREGSRRTAYSLRHTYICLRLTEGADIYQIAKNCRTSVEMIENFYATHIKTTLDASAINVRKVRRKKIEDLPAEEIAI